MQMEIEIKGLKKTIEGLEKDLSNLSRLALEAASAGVRNALDEHFRRRQTEPRRDELNPQGFWSGNSGFSVRESIRPTVFRGNVATIEIDSPALAHKVNPNPPLIKPKGGRKFLTIPVNNATVVRGRKAKDFKLIRKGNTLVDRDTKEPMYILARQVQTRHDPSALPSNASLVSAARAAIRNALGI